MEADAGVVAEGVAGGGWEAPEVLGGFLSAAGILGSSAIATLSGAGADAGDAAEGVSPDAGSGWGSCAGAPAGAVLVFSSCRARADSAVLCETAASAAGSTMPESPEGVGASTAWVAASLGPALACVSLLLSGLGPGAASEDAAAGLEVSSSAAAEEPSDNMGALLLSDVPTGASADSGAAAAGGPADCGVDVGACNTPFNQNILEADKYINDVHPR